MKYVNEFEIYGKVLVIRGGAHPSVRLLSKSGKSDAYPLVFCSPKQIKAAKLRVGMHVEIKGSVHSYNYKDKDGKYVRRQSFYASFIKEDSTLCGDKFDVKGKFYKEYSSRVFLGGSFVSQKERDNGWLSIMLRASEREEDTILVNMRKLDRQPEYKKGDPICIVGTISTVNKDFNGEKVHFENIVVSDIG